jgi:hypothetical protein
VTEVIQVLKDLQVLMVRKVRKVLKESQNPVLLVRLDLKVLKDLPVLQEAMELQANPAPLGY